MNTDQIKRQADADAIRHAAKMIEAVTIEAQTDEGKEVATRFYFMKQQLAWKLNRESVNIERAQP